MDKADFTPDAVNQRFAPYEQSIEYDNRQFREELLPTYEKMMALFREKISLAYPDTAEHFEKFVGFVVLLKRHLDNALPAEALPHLNHTEENLKPSMRTFRQGMTTWFGR